MTRHKCAYCGQTSKPVLRNSWLIPATALAWLVPLGFLSRGYWPVFAGPALVLTVWSLVAVKRECTNCGRPTL